MSDEPLARMLRHLSSRGAIAMLEAVATRPGISTGEVARTLAMRPNLVATTMQILMASGLLLRTRGRTWAGNSVEWQLSDHGRLVLRMIRRMGRVSALGVEERRRMPRRHHGD